jgi:hypothetical protein
MVAYPVCKMTFRELARRGRGHRGHHLFLGGFELVAI